MLGKPHTKSLRNHFCVTIFTVGVRQGFISRPGPENLQAEELARVKAMVELTEVLMGQLVGLLVKARDY